jgi:hypothetical protein
MLFLLVEIGNTPGTITYSIHADFADWHTAFLAYKTMFSVSGLRRKKWNSSDSAPADMRDDVPHCSSFVKNFLTREHKSLHVWDPTRPRLRGGSSKKPRKSARRGVVAPTGGGTAQSSLAHH